MEAKFAKIDFYKIISFFLFQLKLDLDFKINVEDSQTGMGLITLFFLKNNNK